MSSTYDFPGSTSELGAEDPHEPATQREMLTVIMLKDVLDGIEHHFGKDGLELVTDFAMTANRARESNRVMDELERLYGPFSSKER